MRRAMCQVLAAATAVVVLAGAAAGQPAWERFTHPQYGFAISYPAAWETESGQEPFAFVAVGPSPAGVDSVRMNANVTTERVPTDLTVERFEALSESRMGLLFQGYRRLRTDRTTVGQDPALLRYFTWRRNDGVELYQMQLYVVSNGRAYVVTGTTATQSTQLQAEATLLLRIIQTFRLK